MQGQSKIIIVGARHHNLKNIRVEIPRDRLVVVTGVSGSGKSSLAFDTLYAEGQRRYVESLSAYARQFLDRLEKPEVDHISGLTPAIAIEQRSSNPNPRSTIATVTEIHDYLRILFAAIGVPHDPLSGEALHRSTPQSIVEELIRLKEGTRIILCAPLVLQEGETLASVAARLRKQGFLRLRLDGEIRELDQTAEEDLPESAARMEIVIDRLVVRDDIRSRLADSVETTLRWGGTRLLALVQSPGGQRWEEREFTTVYSSGSSDFSLPDLSPKSFSFNSHLGACEECHGLGMRLVPDPERFVPDPSASLKDGAVKTWWSEKNRRGYHQHGLLALAKRLGQDPDAPVRDLSKEFKRALLYGTGSGVGGADGFEGLCVQASRLWEESTSDLTKRRVRRFLSEKVCQACGGKRLRPEILAVKLPHASQDLSIDGFSSLTIEEALEWIGGISLTSQQQQYAPEIIGELRQRLGFLTEVGLGYLTLSRESGSLSGGESQRIRLATQLGAGLAGVLYVLDEPSIGLHPSDNEKLITTLRRLSDLGNTVVVVEHDLETIRAADFVLDLGPGAGEHGGWLLAAGTPAEIEADPASVTGAWLAGRRSIEPPSRDRLRLPEAAFLTVRGAREHNLRGIDVRFPIGAMTCVTGASGSGKSTLVDEILRPVLFRHFHHSREVPGAHDSVEGMEHFERAIVVDQSPLGKGPRSNPATYTGVFGLIRDLFAQLPLSRTRGYGPGRFSFNVAGGRCEVCKGDGSLRIDMHFLSDVYVTCDSCNGRRFNRETLDVTYRGMSIADILEMPVEEAVKFFQNIPGIHQRVRTLRDVGLGYMRLGQPGNTLSGGEAQRVKLATELGKTTVTKAVYLLDEPTTGLHLEDIAVLMGVLGKLRDQGATVILIEHQIDVIQGADWIVDLGPGGGDRGGRLVVEGSPAVVRACPASLTGRYLRKSTAPDPPA